jgi:hypothetical protein
MVGIDESEPKGSGVSSETWADLCRCGHVRGAHQRLNHGEPCGRRHCDCEQFDNRPMGQAETVGEGPEEGEVCVGDPNRPQRTAGHRPAVRGAAGRCYLCEPLSTEELNGRLLRANELADAWLPAHEAVAEEEATLCEELECRHPLALHGNDGCESCYCDAGRLLLPPVLPSVSLNPLPGYRVVYALDGGQQYEAIIPGDASVAVIDGQVRIFHPGRQALGITAIITSPVLSGGEVSSDTEDEGDGW